MGLRSGTGFWLRMAVILLLLWATPNIIIMGDADDSYDLSNLEGFMARLREGDDIVIGTRIHRVTH